MTLGTLLFYLENDSSLFSLSHGWKVGFHEVMTSVSLRTVTCPQDHGSSVFKSQVLPSLLESQDFRDLSFFIYRMEKLGLFNPSVLWFLFEIQTSKPVGGTSEALCPSSKDSMKNKSLFSMQIIPASGLETATS